MTFTPQPWSRSRCTCGVLRHAHATDGACPVMYRPDTIRAAVAALRAAQGKRDVTAEFVARGEVQRLGGNPDEVTP